MGSNSKSSVIPPHFLSSPLSPFEDRIFPFPKFPLPPTGPPSSRIDFTPDRTITDDFFGNDSQPHPIFTDFRLKPPLRRPGDVDFDGREGGCEDRTLSRILEALDCVDSKRKAAPAQCEVETLRRENEELRVRWLEARRESDTLREELIESSRRAALTTEVGRRAGEETERMRRGYDTAVQKLKEMKGRLEEVLDIKKGGKGEEDIPQLCEALQLEVSLLLSLPSIHPPHSLGVSPCSRPQSTASLFTKLEGRLTHSRASTASTLILSRSKASSSKAHRKLSLSPGPPYSSGTHPAPLNTPAVSYREHDALGAVLGLECDCDGMERTKAATIAGKMMDDLAGHLRSSSMKEGAEGKPALRPGKIPSESCKRKTKPAAKPQPRKRDLKKQGKATGSGKAGMK